MKKTIIYIILGMVMVLTLIPASCTDEVTPTPDTTSSPTATPTATDTPEAHWWDRYGEPIYGGSLVCSAPNLESISFDGSLGNPGNDWGFWCERLWGKDWAVDPDEFQFIAGFVPTEYRAGLLATDWEQKDPLTITVHLREGVKWTDKAPVNGRELVASDVEYSFDRVLGTGSGFTEPIMWVAPNFSNVERVVATGTYTVDFKFKSASAWNIYQVMGESTIIAPEWYEQTDIQQWQNAIGTGPWLPTEYIAGSSLTLSKNPDYWGYDERYPENQLPYMDEMTILSITDRAASVAAMRTGKLDMITDMSALGWQEGLNLQKTNPEINQDTIPLAGYGVDLRVDKEPFDDINVRIALQMAIDHDTIAESFYSGTVSGTPCGIASPILFKDWVTPYDEWPAELQEEYSFNPEKARQILADAGYPNGFDTNVITASDYDNQLLQAVQSMFADIGVNMDIEVMDRGSYRAYTGAGKHDQMAYSRIFGNLFDPTQVVSVRATGGSQNLSFTSDPHYDGLVEQFFAASDEETGKEIFGEIDMYSIEQHWSVFIAGRTMPIAWQPWVKGYNGEMMWTVRAGEIRARLWIDESLK